MERIPNSYGPLRTNKESTAVVLEDGEFAQYILGQHGDLSPELRKRIKQALNRADAKTNLFFTAFAQKGMMRLARVMSFLDKVDDELQNNAWRLKSMTNEELVDLLNNLSSDRTRSVKELLAVSAKFSGQVPHLFDDDDETASCDLTRKERQAVTEFLRKRVANIA